MSPFYDCYCVPLTSCAAGYNIQSFSTTGGITNIGNLNSGCDSPVTGHVYYPGQVLTVQRTSTAGFSFTHGSTGPVNYKIWADWNQDGDFMDTLEQVYSNGAVIGILKLPFTTPDPTIEPPDV